MSQKLKEASSNEGMKWAGREENGKLQHTVQVPEEMAGTGSRQGIKPKP